MKQYPSSLKFKKNHKFQKSYLKLNEQKIFYPKEGLFAIRCLNSGILSGIQTEACRKSVKRNVRRVGKIKMNPFMYFSQTAKGVGVRMGSGKGSHSRWICHIRSGYVVCELSGVSLYKSMKALNNAVSKLPIKSKVVKLRY